MQERGVTAAQRAIKGQGREQKWLARMLGMSEAVLSRKLRGTRAFTEAEARELHKLTGLPVDLFLPVTPIVITPAAPAEVA